MKLKITLELRDAAILHHLFCLEPTPFFRRVVDAVRDGERVRLEEAYKPDIAAPLQESAEFVKYIAALDWYFDGDVDSICKLLRQEWTTRNEIPGLNRPFYSDAFPAEFTVEGVAGLVEFARSKRDSKTEQEVNGRKMNTLKHRLDEISDLYGKEEADHD